MTDFRLLRHRCFYHAVARYGSDIWTPFTYAGLHPTREDSNRRCRELSWLAAGHRIHVSVSTSGSLLKPSILW